MDNKQILKIAMKQSAVDIGCQTEDFMKTTNIVVPFKLGTTAKKILLNNPGGNPSPVRRMGFFRNHPFFSIRIYLNLASSNCLPHRPYIVRFIIFNLLLVPSTKPLL